MIIFNTENYKLYNEIIHNFLYVEVFENPKIDKGDILEEILPKYLFREQYKKSLKVLDELYEWTDDKFFHEIGCFHEMMLYYFLEHVSYIKKELEDAFIKYYFKNETIKKIEKISKKLLEDYKKNEDEDCDLDFFLDNFYDVNNYFDILFIDTDFTFIEILYNDFIYGTRSLNKRLGVNLDYYYDILPEDIKEKFPDNHINMTGKISKFLKYLNNKISGGSLSKLLWKNDVPVKEDTIQIVIENMMDAYFHNSDIDVTREARLGNGNIDFKVSDGKEKVLIEVKKAYSSSYLKKGFECQLLDYVNSSNCDNAFFLVACFTDEDIKKYKKFIKENVYTDNYRMYINIDYLDVRKKIAASKKEMHKK